MLRECWRPSNSFRSSTPRPCPEWWISSPSIFPRRINWSSPPVREARSPSAWLGSISNSGGGGRCTITAVPGAGRFCRSIFPCPTMCPCSGWRPAPFRPAHPKPGGLQPPKRKMFDPSSVIVGLEIGTSKVCAVVGEVNASGALGIIGVGQSRSRGVRKGEIVDPELAGEDIRNAIVEAEQMADVEIRSVYLGVTGSHVRGFNNRGVHPVVSAEREITGEDVQDAIKNAKAINLPAENHVVHVVRQHF